MCLSARAGWIAFSVALWTLTANVSSSAEPSKKSMRSRPVARLFFQDLETSTLRWADVRIDAAGTLRLQPVAGIAGFKKLDAAKQKLVQMEEQDGILCVGVRDEEDGTFESGWVLVRTGVEHVDHGDHGHWRFKKEPSVADSRLDAKQGNPAHLYRYGGKFFLANDKLNGYTRIDPANYEGDAKDAPRFLKGGGNHITLAVADDKVGYAAWIDGGGPNKGRVDVTRLTANAVSEPAYSFALPTGNIHGAIVHSGKVFFAPADGICWVDVDFHAKSKREDIRVRHLPLGKDGEKPRRTGAFTSHGKYVVFTTGKDAGSRLALLNATSEKMTPIMVPLDVKKGTQATTPTVAETAGGKAYAFVFHDGLKNGNAEEMLEIVDLDPNGDGDSSDATRRKLMKVGRSAVEGHYGHHDLAFDADRRFAFFTNPGDGTISAMSLENLEIVATFRVGGTPTAIVARGASETND